MLTRHVFPQTLIRHKQFFAHFTFVFVRFDVSQTMLSQRGSMAKRHAAKLANIRLQIFVHILMILQISLLGKGFSAAREVALEIRSTFVAKVRVQMAFHARRRNPFRADLAQTFHFLFALHANVKMRENVLLQWLLHVEPHAAMIARQMLLAMQQHVVVQLLFGRVLFVAFRTDFRFELDNIVASHVSVQIFQRVAMTGRACRTFELVVGIVHHAVVLAKAALCVENFWAVVAWKLRL